MLKRFFARNRQSPDLYGSKFDVFFTGEHIIVNVKAPNPKGTCINRNTTFEPLGVQLGPKLRPVGWRRKWKKRKKKKSQNRYISPPCGGAISQSICTKFGEFVDLTDVITPAKFGCKISLVFPDREVEKLIFPLEIKRPIIYNSTFVTVPCATALVCDKLGSTCLQLGR